MVEPEKINLICPNCGKQQEVLWFPSNKFRVEVPGARAGRTTVWSGSGEKVEGLCECGYKFKPKDLDEC